MGAKTFDEVQAKIQRLTEAESSEEIAKILIEAGVKGMPRLPMRCPIANYLNGSQSGKRYFVGSDSFGDIADVVWEPKTKAMKQFTDEFDFMEKWQELLDESVGV